MTQRLSKRSVHILGHHWTEQLARPLKSGGKAKYGEMPTNETRSIRKASEFAQGIIEIIFEDQFEHDPDTQDMNRL